MYTRIYFNNQTDEIHLWDDKTGYEKFPYKPYAYVADPNGEFVTIDGIRVSKIDTWSETAVMVGNIFEHDIPAETRTLIDRYQDSDEVADYKTMYFDIEVRKNDGYSSIEEAKNEVNAISYTTNKTEQYTVLFLNEKLNRKTETITINVPVEEGQPEIILKNVVLETFSSERELLKYFLNDLNEIDPDILTGWNIDGYDIPYLYNRIINVLGFDYANLLSPIKIVKRDYYKKNIEVRIAGRYGLDYMKLYKTFNYSEEPSYALNAIAKKELGRGKVDYIGSLDDLCFSNPMEFIRYSVVDTELLKTLDNKLDFIDIATGICHKGHVGYNNVWFPSVYLEGSMLTYMRRKGQICMQRPHNDDKTQAIGAYVKQPTPGLYRWIYDLDLTSLYPFNLISLNASPETKVGFIDKFNIDEFVNDTDRKYIFKKKRLSIKEYFSVENEDNEKRFDSYSELRDFLLENKYTISSAGIIYKTDIKGIIPEILTTWFAERKHYKNLMIAAGNDKDTNKENYYHKKQLVAKIQLNSLYGVLLLPTFRFYDKQNGESVTLTGQTVIKWSAYVADAYYNKILEPFKGTYEIELENGKIKSYDWCDIVNTKSGKKFVFLLTENDELV